MNSMKKDFENKAAAQSGEITPLKLKLQECEAKAANALLATDASSQQAGFIRDLRRQHELADSENVAMKATSDELRTGLEWSTFK